MQRRRSRSYCFTLNNPSDDEVLVPQAWEENYNYLVYQLEVGEEGTPHLQGYINFKNPVEFDAFRHYFPGTRARIVIAKGTAKQNRTYCTKEEGRLDGPWEFGRLPEQGKRSDLLAMKEDLDDGASLREISENYFGNFLRYRSSIQAYKVLRVQNTSEAKTIKCLWGPTGVGKTRTCFEEHPDAYWKTRDPGTAQYWDGYDGEECIIVDEFYGWLPWDFILRLTDRYPLKLAVKGSTVPCTAKTIVFTSNKHPSKWYPNSRYFWDDTNPLKRRFGDGIRELGTNSTNNTSLGGSIPPVSAVFRNGLPSGDISPIDLYSLVGDDEVGIGC